MPPGILHVGVLAYPGCFASSVYGVPDMLTMATHLSGRLNGDTVTCRVSIVSPRRSVTAAGMVPIAVTPLAAVADQLDLLIVPGYETPNHDLDSPLQPLRPEMAAIAAHAAADRPVVSTCVGAFLLGAAGLLDGRRATTCWMYAAELARRHPLAAIQPDRLVITDTGVTTAAAFTAMYNYALDLIRHLYSDGIALATAWATLTDDARTSETPYVEPGLLPRPGGEFAGAVMAVLEADLAGRYNLTALAASVNVSTRTLLRRFRAETGQSPLEYLRAARVERARVLLETTDRPVAAIAAAVGYSDASTFAALFAARTGKRPRDYRAAFKRA
ncbi:GlxA family transcriptional regulator [Nonomuraea sp. NPDC050536]|uniref:GlxA family transcriptional regulator n=1 Tax=Nonomuraea sp. NPDC050536 TaxID=3364366 RepID=UPI0037CB881E